MNIYLRFISIAAIYACALSYVDRMMYKKNKGFICWEILGSRGATELINHSCLRTTLSTEQIKKIFNHPLTYLGRGHQSVVFLTHDKEYVVKFYRFPVHMRPLGWMARPLAPFSKKRKNIQLYDEKKYTETLKSHTLCFEELPQQSALVLTHLSLSDELHIKATLITPSGAPLRVELDKMVFIVQKKGELLFSTLDRLINDKKIDDAKEIIKNTIDFFITRAERGYVDKDAVLHKNYGLIGRQIFQLDTGRVEKLAVPLTRQRAKEIAKEITTPLKNYLSIQSAELYALYHELFAED